MKRILSKRRSRMCRDNGGMSLVEVLCAVAILALVSGVIGSVIVISTRTYSKGVSETNIQQEAQLAANNIGNLVKDACSVIYGESGAQYIQDGDTPMTNPDTSPKMQSDNITELSIITNDKKQYTVKYYNGANGDSYKETLWYEIIAPSPSDSSGPQLMAKNVSEFKAVTTDFRENKTIKLTMTVKDGNREIPMEYTMTSRNGVGEGVVYTPVSDSANILIDDSEVVLVPGEEYKVEFSVLGDIKEEDLEWGSSEGFEVADSIAINPADKSDGSARILVPVDTTKTECQLVIKTKDSVTPSVSGTIKVKVRKVNKVDVSYTVNTENARGGMMEAAGAEYTFSAGVSGNVLAKNVAYDYDKHYEIAQAAVWSFKLHADGRDITRDWTCAQNPANGNKWEFTHAYTEGDEAAFNEYFEILKEDDTTASPQFSLKLKKDMPADFELTVRATSRHALGVNKAKSQYSLIYYGEKVVQPRKTLVNSSTKYVLLEPNEDAVVDVKVLGAGMSQADTVSIDYNHKYKRQDGTEYEADSRSDMTTKAEYDVDAKTVKITAGRDEKGHKEYNSNIGSEVYDYNVYVNLVTSGGERCTIIVNISRIDVISLELEHPASSEKGVTDSGKDIRRYRFNVRFNTDLEHKYKSLMQYLTPDEEKAKRNLATKFTITYENTATGKELAKNEVTIDGAGNVLSGTLPNKEGPNKDYSILVTSSIGNKIEKDMNNPDSGYEFINPSSTPHVFVSLRDDNLPMNRKLTVRAEVMHPTGGDWNNKNSAYATVEAVEKYIEGPQKLELDSDIVIVEPGQGSDDNKSNDKEMVIPITVSNGSTYKMTAELDGNSDSATRLTAAVRDSFGNNSNPYTTTSYKAGSEWTWYLGLWIGKNERGRNDTGLIDVTLKAFDTNNNQLEEKKFQLAVRRVNEVDLKVSGSSDINKINKANKKITLMAYPKGYGKDKVEYFAKQTKPNSTEVCRWETTGHGAYKSPYPMKWMMEYKNDKKEIKDWTEYFSNVSVNKNEYDKEHRESITFTLKKALPSGAKIRAYSLHALGTDKGANYNKACAKYDEVYGELVINGSYVKADGFQRADDFDFVKSSPFPWMRSYFTQGIYNSTQRTFFRYREAGTEWNATNKQYRIMDSEGEREAFFSGNLGSRLFLPDKEYELDIINVVYGTGPQGQKVIYWPQDESLLEAGNGWSEAGYKLWDGTWGHTEWGQIKDENGNVVKDEWGNDKWGNVDKYKEVYEEVKNTPQEPHKYLIPKTEIAFAPIDNPNEWNETISERMKTIGSESKPKQLSNSGAGNGTNYDKHFAVKLAPTSFNIDKTQLHFTAKIDKWENNQWVHMVSLTQNSSMNEAQYKWFLQVSVPKFDIYHVRTDASGKYRVRSTVTGMTWTKITGGLFDTGASRYQEYVVDNIDLFDMSDESGVMYLQLN